MRKVRFVCVGKLKEREYAALCAEYLKRLRGFCSPEVVEIPERPLPDGASAAQVAAALRAEAADVRRAVPPDAFLVALCVEGEQMTSERLAERLSELSMRRPAVCFAVGGSNGLSEELKREADLRLSFSPMTFPHHLFRVMLLEQVYRAFSIGAGRAYHK